MDNSTCLEDPYRSHLSQYAAGHMEGPQDPLAGRRIFVARIPPNVTGEQFRSYFGRYGRIDDAYMPKDRTRQAYRGIGFVTYSDPSSTDNVIAVRHRFGDHDIVVDRAAPKNAPGSGPYLQSPSEQSCSLDQMQFGNLMACQSNRMQGPPLTSLTSAIGLSSDGITHMEPSLQSIQFENQMKLFQVLREQQQHMGMAHRPESLLDMEHAQGTVSTSGLVLPPGLLPDLGVEQVSSGLASLMGPMSQGIGMVNSLPRGLQLDSNLFANLKELTARALDSATAPSPLTAGNLGSGVQNGGYPIVGSDVPLPAPSVGSSQGADTSRVTKARSGPRLFVGKLSKETSEQDLREHFSKFGFVMDVFMPRAKENKKGHRGFGFITFETEAAIQRVVAHGTHRIKNSVIAIDVAVPEESAVTQT